MKEMILCAAIWYKDLPTQNYLPINIKQGIVVCGYRHTHCIDIMKILSGLRTVKNSSDGVGETIQGFLTNTNKFVDRTDAYNIASKMNQLNDRHHTIGTLYSEDIY